MNVIFDQNVYTRQPAVLTVSDWDGEAEWLKVVVRTAPSVTTWYKLPTNGNTFAVNLIDVIRYLYQMASSLSEVVVSTYDEDKTNVIDAAQTISFYKAGTIDPAKVLRPRVSLKQTADSNGLGIEHVKVCAPSYMLRGEVLSRVIMEMWTDNPTDGEYYNFGQVVCAQVFDYAVTTKNFEIPAAAEDWNDTHIDDGSCENEHITINLFGGATFVFAMQPQDCRKTYAAVEWESSFGVTRRHIFEVTKQTNNADNVIALETVGNGWDEHKGQLCGCTLRLESLSRYDYWYYADLILSDKAKITFDGSNWYTLQVTAKGYTLPDGNDSGKLNTLEIPVNYCRYDTI